MNKLFLYLFLIFTLLCIKSVGQPSSLKHAIFQVTSPDLPDTAKVYITGSIPQLGMWNPSSVPMKFSGNKTWTKIIDIDSLSSIEYKFTLGSWEREAADASGNPFPNFAVKVKRDTAINHQILFWKSRGSARVNHGQITGTVKYHRGLGGNGLLERDVIVWLPPGYKNSGPGYPVLYMQDGQNIIDPTTSAFGVDWRIDETSDSLIRNQICKPFIVVGIYNTANRGKEYTPGGEGEAYMDFVVNIVKPLIDTTYRTLMHRYNTFVGGSSAGGLISFMLAWEYPEIFGGAICMSPAFKIMNIDYVKDVLESGKKRNVFFYIDNGGVALETRLQPGVDAMLDALKGKGYKLGQDFTYISDPNARHFEADWAKRFPNAIMSIFKSPNVRRYIWR